MLLRPLNSQRTCLVLFCISLCRHLFIIVLYVICFYFLSCSLCILFCPLCPCTFFCKNCKSLSLKLHAFHQQWLALPTCPEVIIVVSFGLQNAHLRFPQPNQSRQTATHTEPVFLLPTENRFLLKGGLFFFLSLKWFSKFWLLSANIFLKAAQEKCSRQDI